MSRRVDVRRWADGNGRFPAAEPVVLLWQTPLQLSAMDSFAGTFLALLVLATNNLPTGQWIMDRDVCVCVFVEILLFAFGPSRQTFHQFGFRRKHIRS